jgi:primase-polymerase (primpol)-like protein
VDLPERIQPDEILERAKRDDKFERLWSGDHAEYPSQSEADMALCCSLAYRTGGDLQLMDELFRQSGLMRPKWDEDRGDQTYGELTLQKAVQFVDDVDPYLTEGAVEIQTLSEIDPRETATVEVEVVAAEDPSGEKRAQTGRVTDDTRALRFVRWDSKDGPTPELVVGERYRLENVWVKTFDGRKEIQINEHTTIEKLSE